MGFKKATKEIDQLIKEFTNGEIKYYDERLHKILLEVYTDGIKACSGIMKAMKDMTDYTPNPLYKKHTDRLRTVFAEASMERITYDIYLERLDVIIEEIEREAAEGGYEKALDDGIDQSELD